MEQLYKWTIKKIVNQEELNQALLALSLTTQPLHYTFCNNFTLHHSINFIASSCSKFYYSIEMLPYKEISWPT